MTVDYDDFIKRAKLQGNEFDAANELVLALGIINMTVVVDDDYPEIRHRYENALASFIQSMKKNGRFEAGNRYGLVCTP